MSEPRRNERSPEQVRAHVQALMGEATLLRVRGVYDEAEARCLEALDLDRSHAEGRELLADVLMAQGRPAEAVAQYRWALQQAPGRAALETKLARAVLRQAALEQERQLAQELLEGKLTPEAERKPGPAALLSGLIPGLGQLYNHELAKGMVLACLFVVAVVGLALSALGGVAAAVRAGAPQAGAAPQPANVVLSGRALWWLALLVVVWLYAVGDAAVEASRTVYDRAFGGRGGAGGSLRTPPR